MNKKKIGLRIKSIRVENGLSQGDFAKRLGMDRSTVSKIENGDNTPTAKILIALGQLFTISIDWILTGHGFRDKIVTEEYNQDVMELLDDFKQNKQLKHAILGFYYTYKGDLKELSKAEDLPQGNGNNGG